MFFEEFKAYAHPTVLLMGLIGFFAGLPLLLTGPTMALWLTEEGIDLTTVGTIGLVALPYSIKFLWSPFIDCIRIPLLAKYLGDRKSWFFCSQLLVTLSIYLLSTLDPKQNLKAIVIVSIILAFAAATLEIIVLAYNVQRLHKTQYGVGEAMCITGYRIGMIVASAGSLYLATFLHWKNVYQIMAFISSIGVIIALLIEEPQDIRAENQKTIIKTKEFIKNIPILNTHVVNTLSLLYQVVICPFSDLMKKRNWLIAMIILFIYKASDNLIGNMHSIFYTDIGFSKEEIANVSKLFGTFASIFGGILGGVIVNRLGMLKGLFFGSLIHALSILFYIILCNSEHNILLLYIIVAAEHFTGGIRTTALFAYRLTLCSKAYATTQMALMASIISMGRPIFSSFSGFIIASLGWEKFFIIAALLSIPGLLMLMWLAFKSNFTGM